MPQTNEAKEALVNILHAMKEETIAHWYALVPGQFYTKEFYEAVEKELSECKVPGMTIERVDFAEGGLLSAKREYLALRRERLLFVVCSAPFGTSHFYSFRLVELPLIKPMDFVVFFVGIGLVFGLLAKVLGTLGGFALLLAILGAGVHVMRNPSVLGIKDLDTTLIRTPVIGPIFECFFRPDTYYRIDSRLMYLETVNAVVKAKVEEATSAQGIKLIRFNEHSPILGDLYKAKTVELNTSSPPA